MTQQEEKLVILMSDDRASGHAHRNTPSHFVNEFNTPIELDGEWEMGVTEIDFFNMRPNSSWLKLKLKVVSFVHLVDDPIFVGEYSETPYGFPDGMGTISPSFEIKIPNTTEGLAKIKQRFKESNAHIQMLDHIDIDYSLEYLKVTSRPFEWPSGTWNYVVPDETSDWKRSFDYKWDNLRDWRWYVRNPNDEVLSPDSAVLVGYDVTDKTTVFASDYQITLIIPESEFDSKKRVVSQDNHYAAAIPNSAIGQGALCLSGFTAKTFFKNISQDTLQYDAYKPNEGEYKLAFDPAEENWTPPTDLAALPVKEFYARRNSWDLTDASDYWIVYCNVVEDSLISHTMAPILRILPNNSWYTKEDHFHLEFYPIHYKRVVTSRIDSIKILIASTIGQYIPFNGRVRIVCKLRRVRSKRNNDVRQ